MHGPEMRPYHDWKNNAWVSYAVQEKGLETISPLGCWWRGSLLNPIEDDVQSLTLDCDGADSPDFELAVPMVWLAWHLKLMLSSLAACVHTHTNCWLVGEPMLNQIASLEDWEPKSTLTSTLCCMRQETLRPLMSNHGEIVLCMKLFWESTFGLVNFPGIEQWL